MDIPACKRVLVGWGVTSKGQRILTLHPELSGQNTCPQFGLPLEHAKQFVTELQRHIVLAEASLKPAN